jgi:hypothetical protein
MTDSLDDKIIDTPEGAMTWAEWKKGASRSTCFTSLQGQRPSQQGETPDRRHMIRNFGGRAPGRPFASTTAGMGPAHRSDCGATLWPRPTAARHRHPWLWIIGPLKSINSGVLSPPAIDGNAIGRAKSSPRTGQQPGSPDPQATVPSS